MPTPAPIVLALTLAKPGGTTSFVFRFACWLQARGEAVIIFVGEEGTWLRERCQEAHIPFRVIPHLRRSIHPWNDVRAVHSFRRALREVNPRALHLNSSKAGVIGSLAGALEHQPQIVYCIGGWAALDARSRWQYLSYLWPERLSARWKDTIVCLHPGDAAFAKTHGIKPKKEVVVIPNGLDLAATRAALLPRHTARTELGLSDQAFVFGTIANFYPAKNLPAYLEACAQIVAEDARVRFCLIGDGPERPLIEQAIATHHLEKYVILARSKENAAQFLPAFDAFVLPSKKEGMPFSLLEAAAADLPIITTDVGAHRWMLPEMTIVRPQNTPELVDALRQMKNQPLVPNYQPSLQRFQEEACFEAHLALLNGQKNVS